MDEQSQAMFDQIVELDADAISQDQLAFLMARRSYMNAEQKKRWANEIDLHEEGKLFVADLPVAEMNLKQLKAKASELGLEVKKGAKLEDVRALVEGALAE